MSSTNDAMATQSVAGEGIGQSESFRLAIADKSESARLRAVYGYAVLDTPPEPNFDRVTNLAANIFGLPISTLCLADADRHFFKSRHGVNATEMPRKLSFCDVTLRNEDGFIVPDATADRRFHAAPIVAGPPNIRFYAGAPLINPSGIPIGTLCVLDSEPHLDFDARKARILADLADTVGELLEARLRQIQLAACTAELALIARQDPLTGLPNRRMLHEQIEHVLAHTRNDEQIAVLYIDLDHFKEVNDTLGHGVGDALLQEVAAHLCANVRNTDHIARLGGDEFAVILSGQEVKLQALELAGRLIRTISEPCKVLGHTVHIGVSIGIALGQNVGQGWPQLEDMFKDADTALYQAKSGGRGMSCFFERGMSTMRRDLSSKS